MSVLIKNNLNQFSSKLQYGITLHLKTQTPTWKSAMELGIPSQVKSHCTYKIYKNISG